MATASAVTYRYVIPDVEHTSFRRPFTSPEVEWVRRKWRIQVFEGSADYNGDLCVKVQHIPASWDSYPFCFTLTLRLLPFLEEKNVRCRSRRGNIVPETPSEKHEWRTAGGFLYRKALVEGNPYCHDGRTEMELTLELAEEVIENEIGVREWDEESVISQESQTAHIKQPHPGTKLTRTRPNYTRDLLKKWKQHKETSNKDGQKSFGTESNVDSLDIDKTREGQMTNIPTHRPLSRRKSQQSWRENLNRRISKKMLLPKHKGNEPQSTTARNNREEEESTQQQCAKGMGRTEEQEEEEKESMKNLTAIVLKNDREIQENEEAIRVLVQNLEEGEKRIQTQLALLHQNLADIAESETVLKSNSDILYQELRYYRNLYLEKFGTNSYESRCLPLPMCFLCKRRPVGRLLLPCNHCCVCPPCATILAYCPRCTKKINYVVKYYY